ncbi:hypothetical protein [Marispirochaeta sp.]|jgi:hypothetical protein|uniref:hypothetical protein n=1 Tax=Marispirochaeta sp. TaxID=2038653 RepID=UPI0029C85F4B|nr:hypothetical protein [Marispirochaeta sp.]
MKCVEWKKIQDELDAGQGFSAAVQDHLTGCPRCSRNLEVYRRLIKSYEKEAASPSFDRNPVYAIASRRKPALLSVAAVFVFMIVAGGLLAVPHFQDKALRQEYSREISESLIDGGLFEYAQANDPGYESSWF